MTKSHELNSKKAVLWMVMSVVCFSLLSFFVKQIAHGVDESVIVFFRSFINLLIVLTWMWFRKEKFYQGHLKVLLLRGFFGFVGIVALFYGVAHLPLGIASLLSFSSPIFVLVASPFVLGEKIYRLQIFLVMFAFLGLYLLLAPQHFNDIHAIPLDYRVVTFSLIGSFCSGMAYISIRKASKWVSTLAIVFYFMVVSTTLSFPFALRIFLQGVQFSSEQVFYLIFIGLTSTLAQISMTMAYRFGRASFVSSINLLNPILSSILGFFIFNEQLSVVQISGMFLVVSSIGFLAFRETSMLTK